LPAQFSRGAGCCCAGVNRDIMPPATIAPVDLRNSRLFIVSIDLSRPSMKFHMCSTSIGCIGKRGNRELDTPVSSLFFPLSEITPAHNATSLLGPGPLVQTSRRQHHPAVSLLAVKRLADSRADNYLKTNIEYSSPFCRLFRANR
jgi:hypothetical protein